jgi:SAM-dependent methyltransferase
MEAVVRGNRALSFYHGGRGTISQYRGGKTFSLMLKRLRASGILLDVGCAEGFFLFGVEENSQWKAEGVEIVPSAVQFANNRLGVKVYQSTLDNLEGLEERYHFIRMNNVIEHVQNPITFLKKAHRLLKGDGLVYCSTPNGFQDGQCLQAANDRGIVINLLENHFFYYLPKTLSEMFRSCGFKVLKIYCEDISHTFSNLGLLPWFRYPKKTQSLKMTDFVHGTDSPIRITDQEIANLKDHPGLETWRLTIQWIRNEYFRLKFPSFLPLGHQQHIWARKVTS